MYRDSLDELLYPRLSRSQTGSQGQAGAVTVLEKPDDYPLPVAEDWADQVNRATEMARVIDGHLDYQEKLQGRGLDPVWLCRDQRINLATDVYRVAGIAGGGDDGETVTLWEGVELARVIHRYFRQHRVWRARELSDESRMRLARDLEACMRGEMYVGCKPNEWLAEQISEIHYFLSSLAASDPHHSW